MATIRDVAKKSGVSIATVSHVLNNRTSKVGLDTREKVLAAVRELKYRPTVYEGKSNEKRTRTLAFISQVMSVEDIHRNEYFRETMLGAMAETAAHGYHLLVSFEDVWEDTQRVVRQRFDGRVDGVILCAPRLDGREADVLTQRGTPVISIGSQLDTAGVSCVDIENVASAEKATRQLLDLGHRQIAYIGAGREIGSSSERARGYERAMLEAGIADNHICAVFGRFASPTEAARGAHERMRARMRTTEGIHEAEGWGPEAVDVLLQKMPGVTGIVVWSIALAQSVVNALSDHGLRVPQDVSIVTFDAQPADATHSFSTYIQPLHLIGRTAARILLDRIERDELPAQTIRFEPDFVHGSTLAPPVSRTQIQSRAFAAVHSNGGIT